MGKIPTMAEIMTHPVVTLAPDLPMMEAARILTEKHISGAPVVDARGGILGVLSEFDCIEDVASRQYHEDQFLEYTVGDLMTKQVLTISKDTDLFGAAGEMVAHRVRRLPVMDGDRLVGIVSRRDILKALFLHLRKAQQGKGYPDYPKDRVPIRDYPHED